MANTYRHTADFAPYYDDWESAKHDEKGYVKVLFKPSVAVQARELNQTQTYLNSQIASLGGYLFKDGTPVSGAKISYVTNQKYAIASIMYDSAYTFEEIKEGILNANKIDTEDSSSDDISSDMSDYTLEGIPTSAYTENTSETVITNDTSFGTSIENINTNPVIQITGFFEYENPNDSENEDNIATLTSMIDRTVVKRVIVLYNLYGGEFANNQSYKFTAKNNLCTIRFDIVSTCTTASCTKGIIFVDGYFINVPMTTVLVNPFNELDVNFPLASFGLKDISNDDVQYNVGFWIERDIVTSYEDSTLTDPASGSYNYKAPGADRYKILGKLCCITDEKLASELEKYEVDNSVKFVTGIVLKNNILIKEQNNVGTNSDLMDELAKRTYEESGNYAVNPWKVQIEDYKANASIVNSEEDDVNKAKYIVSIEPGLGYVYGYRVSNVVSQKFVNEKSRKTAIKKNNSKYTDASRCTYTEDLYSDDIEILNDLNVNINLHSHNLQNVINSNRCLLVDRQISETLIIRGDNTQNTNSGTSAIVDVIDPSDAITNMTYSDLTEEEKYKLYYNNEVIANVVGEVTVSNLLSNGDGSIILYVNNFNNSNNIYELSNAFALVSIAKKESTNNSSNEETSIVYDVTGYVDLKIDKDSKKSIWEGNEAPYIFETDYSYVANTTDAYENFNLEYNVVLSSYSTNYNIISLDSNSRNVGKIIFDSVNYGIAPKVKPLIVCLIDSNGHTYSSEEYELIKDNNDVSFIIQLNPMSGHTLPPTATSETTGTSFTIYYVATLENNNGNNTTGGQLLKYKTLKIKEKRISYSDIISDCIELEDYDLITLLSIKKSSKTIEEINYFLSESNDIISTDSSAEEILYDGEDSLTLSKFANYIELDTQATDFCYRKSKIYGIKSFIEARNASVKNGTSNTSTEPVTLIIKYAYYEHSSHGAGFYCALSYNVDPTLINRTDLTVIKERLYNYFNVTGIYESASEQSNQPIATESYNLIPMYKSFSGSQYNLANCIDFRQDYDESSSNFSPINPLPSSNITYDLSIYLPRIDNVWVDKSGNFGITKGVPSENPVAPAEIDGAMVIYRLYNRPYGKTIDDIIPTYIDNRRHTMKDISKLTERVTALEEVVSMSLIEQSAVNLQITDDDGVTRYKCGIFTDTFSNFDNCNINDEEWSASIDSVEKSIRPYFTNVDWSISPIGEYTSPKKTGTSTDTNDINGYKLVSDGNNNYSTQLYDSDNDNDKVTGVICWNNSIITLKPLDMKNSRDKKLQYTNSSVNTVSDWNYPSDFSYVYAKNINCTETTNVQSLMFATWSGNLTLYPAIDTWVNDLGDIIATTTYENSEKPATVYRTWTTTTTNSFDTTETTTVASGLSAADIKKLYGSDKAATEAGKLHQRVVEKGTKVANGGNGVGHWEPAETTTTIRSYETTTTTTVTEKTSYTGSYIANDMTTYMEQQDAFMRVRFVEFSLKGMRPNNQIYATMDGVSLKLVNIEDYNSNLKPEDINANTSGYNTITTDKNGDANGYIVIPNKMPVGTKVVQFFDEENLATCHADYTANGKTVWNNIDRTYVRQWNPVTTQSTKTKTSDPVFTGATRTITATEIFKEEDPIAESFYISQENGIMLEAIDIFFAAKDVSIGVELFIVECENGYPGQTVVPFSRVFVSAKDVKITTQKTIETATVKTLPKPTTFKFPVPIYLHPKQEYAFIVIAPSYNYEIYTSTLGKVDLVTNKEIKEQPYTGSMFKSQNLRTWTAEQEQDIMFVMYSMKFNTNSDGFPVYFGLDDMMAKRTGLTSTLPTFLDQTRNAYDMMNISAGTFMPNMTDIAFRYKLATDDKALTTEWIDYNNKQDIFLKSAVKLASNANNYTGSEENVETSTNKTEKFKNNNSALKIMAVLSTGDANVTPQIDIEDFHGIFARNVIASTTTNINNVKYYKAGAYVSNSILLKEPAIGIKVIMDAILPRNSLIKTYYKLTNVASKYYTLLPNANAETFMNQTVVNNNRYVSPQSNEENVLKDTISSQIGILENNLDKILNNLCYIWYHVYDAVDKRYKFICPTQLYSNSTSYVAPSFVPSKGDVTENGIELIINKANNIEVFKEAVIEGNTFSYYRKNENFYDTDYNNRLYNSNYSLIGVYAIPVNDSGMYTPNDIITGKSTTRMSTILDKQYNIESIITDGDDDDDETITKTPINSYFKTIICSDYDSGYTYLPGEMCIYRNKLYINNGIVSIRNIAPVSSNDTNMGWYEIPCTLLTKQYTKKESDNATWLDMTCNEYKQTTERETNFMEYTYSTIESSEDTNFFDEFTLKIELYCLDQCNIPRFRNLRAIAVV